MKAMTTVHGAPGTTRCVIEESIGTRTETQVCTVHCQHLSWVECQAGCVQWLGAFNSLLQPQCCNHACLIQSTLLPQFTALAIPLSLVTHDYFCQKVCRFCFSFSTLWCLSELSHTCNASRHKAWHIATPNEEQHRRIGAALSCFAIRCAQQNTGMDRLCAGPIVTQAYNVDARLRAGAG